MDEHSPEPWKITNEPEDDGYRFVIDAAGNQVMGARAGVGQDNGAAGGFAAYARTRKVEYAGGTSRVTSFLSRGQIEKP